ncbi:hypothetical protein LCGC14_3066260 [marine sediment metagenome]|uniref:Uncharacterized protein n=1 Tax=marine sediment metagenome TaxID=412755 RepID=A0A0F8WI13_9ZZZZ
MTTKHTPLPWLVLGSRSDGKRFIKREGWTASTAIASTNYDADGRNADFIVRAANNFYPLLKALENIRRMATTDPTNLPQKMFAGDIAARATAAIEEAKKEA